jgi:capsular exopolysaccharide synthesis family protein
MSDSIDEPAERNQPSRYSGVQLAVRLHRFKSLIIRYWWLLILAVAIGLAVQAYRCAREPVRYLSTSRMMVSGRVAIPQGEMYSEELTNFYGTQVTLMKSPDTIRQSIERVHAIHPEVAVDDSATVDAFQEPRTSIFDLQVVSTNPQYAKLLLDAIMDTYLSSKRGRKDQTTNGAISAITEEIAHLDVQIRDDQQALLDFQKQNNVVFIEEQSNSAGTYLVGLNNEMAQLSKEHDLLLLESKDPAASSLPVEPSANTPPTTTATADTNAAPVPGTDSEADADANTSILSIQDDIAKLKIRRDELGKFLKDQHPKMIALSDEIDNDQQFLELLKSRNVSARDARRENLELQIKNLTQQIAQWNQKSLDLSERLGTYQQLKSKAEREQALYNQLASSIQNVNLNKSLDQEDVVTLEPASAANAVNANYIRQILFGMVYGFAGGMALIYLINRLDDKIDSPLELEENIDYPLIGQIPLAIVDNKTKRVPLLSESDQRQVLLESHRNIRSSILFRASSSAKLRSLLITSSVPGEGKSTLVANLAVTFAMSKTRILLIDADFRKGLLHTIFDVAVAPGLSEYLRQQVSWRDAVQKTQYPNLDFMPRGKIRDQAGDYLLDAATDVLLKESVEEYDLVLWDSAPVLATDEASSLCSKVDGVVFLARVRYSSINSMRSALKELTQRGGKITGIVLNAVQPDQPSYYDRYRYKEYYTSASEG